MKAPTLWDVAAEQMAYRSGRSKSQEKAELLHPERADDFAMMWECICGGIIGRDPKARCPKCGT